MVKTIIVSSDGTIIGIGDELIEDTKEPGVVWLDGVGFGVPGQKVYEFGLRELMMVKQLEKKCQVYLIFEKLSQKLLTPHRCIFCA